MKKIILILFLLSGKLTFGQITNGGFEVWDTTYTACYDSDLINLFAIPNPSGGEVNNWTGYNAPNTCGIARTTDSYSGNYSLLLYNWYNYSYGEITYHDSLSYRPQYLQGYFKYITGGVNGLSQGTVKVSLTRFNGTSIDTIATGTYQFDSTASFTPFQLNLNYISALNPDSIDIYIINGNNNCGPDMICNLLYLDNLTLTNSPLGIENLSLSDIVPVYPNPTSGKFTIEAKGDLEIYNTLGEKIYEQEINTSTTEIDLATQPKGIYFVRIIAEGKIPKANKIIIH